MASADRIVDYSARHLSVLEGLEAVRKRPGMYIGSTDSRGLMHCLWEIIDNSVDEALAGHGTDIEVVLHPDQSVEVRDTARGIPVDIEPKTGLSGVEVVFTKLHAGGKFGSGSYAASGGLHGVGASVVNALSERLDVEVDRDGKTWAMSFHRGEPGMFADADPADPTPGCAVHAVRVEQRAARRRQGRQGRHRHAHPLLGRPADLHQGRDLPGRRADRARAADRVPRAGARHPHRRAARRRARPPRRSASPAASASSSTSSPPTRRSPAPGASRAPARTPRRCRCCKRTGTWSRPSCNRECEVDIALRWGTGYDTVFRSYVNIIATPKGGTHQAGFEQGLMKFLRSEVEKNARRLKVGTDKLEKEDILAGLTAVLTVRLARAAVRGSDERDPGHAGDPQHRRERRSRRRWPSGSPARKRDDKAQSALVLDKIVAEMKSRISARAHKETQRRKNALESSTLPAKLVDCRSNDVAGTELFIVEGDSALGTAKLARDSEFQALLPIRGKILNVQKASVSDMLVERRVRVDHPGDRRRFGPHVRPRAGALRQGHHHERRRCRRRPHPHPAADPVLPVHARR